MLLLRDAFLILQRYAKIKRRTLIKYYWSRFNKQQMYCVFLAWILWCVSASCVLVWYVLRFLCFRFWLCFLLFILCVSGIYSVVCIMYFAHFVFQVSGFDCVYYVFILCFLHIFYGVHTISVWCAYYIFYVFLACILWCGLASGVLVWYVVRFLWFTFWLCISCGCIVCFLHVFCGVHIIFVICVSCMYSMVGIL